MKILYCECIAKNLWFCEIIFELLKQISPKQEYLTSQNCFQLENSYTFFKAILHDCQRQHKFEYLYSSFVYSMSDNVLYYIDYTMLLSAEKQRSVALLSTKDKRIAIYENQR